MVYCGLLRVSRETDAGSGTEFWFYMRRSVDLMDSRPQHLH